MLKLDNKADITILSQVFQNALDPVLAKYGLEKYKVNVTFGNNRMEFKIIVNSNNDDAASEAFSNLCGRYGIVATDYKSIKQIQGINYQLLGFDPKARKYPCIVLDMSRNVKMKMSARAWISN